MPILRKGNKGGGMMSMISEQIKKFRYFSLDNEIDMLGVRELQMLLEEAADTIEELSAKLVSANMERLTAYYNDDWIPVSERLPQRGTRVLVTFKAESGSMGIEDCWYSSSECFKTYKDFELMSQYIEIIAWRELPAPYQPKGENNE